MVGLIALCLVALNVWWVAVNRHGYPLDVDEAGYTSIGLSDYLGLRTGGIHGWWEAVQSQTPNAPLVPAVTSLLLLIKPGVLEGFGTLIGFGVLLTFAAYGIGDKLAGPRLGALSALAVATSQGAFIFTREYIFALPTAALLSSAVYALLNSDVLRRRWWSIGCGAALGLMVLARTMAIAFVPGVLVAALLVIVLRGRADLRVRLLNFALLIAAGVLVGLTWYWRNLQPVFDYLTNYGYGSQSRYYGTEHFLLSWARIRGVAERMISDDLLVPLAVLVFIGLLVGLAFLVKRLVDADDRRSEALRIAGSKPITVSIVFLSGYVALMSSRNGGDGFTFPLAMLLPPLAVASLRLVRSAIVPVVALVGAIAAVNVVAATDLWNSASETQTVEVPAFGELPWVSGAPHAVGAIRVQVPGSPLRFEARDKGWVKVDEELATLFHEPVGPEGQQPFVAFGTGNRVVNTNTVGLASLLNYHQSIPLTQLSAEPRDTVANYVNQLTEPARGLPTGLVTMSTSVGDFPPLMTQWKVEAAARQLGFHRIREIRLPDGRILRVWVKSST